MKADGNMTETPADSRICRDCGRASTSSEQIVLQEADTMPPAITRARQFIEEHHADLLSLAQVSKAVNISTFYFCKLFKKVMGMKFTEFVSRTRVEKAKTQLLNRNLRISEVAFVVGFQSLTHFNRVFRRLTGESPTEYRRRLPVVVERYSVAGGAARTTRVGEMQTLAQRNGGSSRLGPCHPATSGICSVP